MQFVVMFLAVIRCRAIAASLNQAYTAKEFEFYLFDSESKLLITPKEGLQSAQSAASKLKLPQMTATLSDGMSSISIGNSVSIDSNSESVKELVNDPSNVALFLHVRHHEPTQGQARRSYGKARQSTPITNSVKTEQRGGLHGEQGWQTQSLSLSQTSLLSLSLSLSLSLKVRD